MRSLFSAFLFVCLASGTALADENLVEKREACQAEARRHIMPKSRINAELSKSIIAKRLAYVQDCMSGKRAKERKKGS